jgi:hypothetical protein
MTSTPPASPSAGWRGVTTQEITIWIIRVRLRRNGETVDLRTTEYPDLFRTVSLQNTRIRATTCRCNIKPPSRVPTPWINSSQPPCMEAVCIGIPPAPYTFPYVSLYRLSRNNSVNLIAIGRTNAIFLDASTPIPPRNEEDLTTVRQIRCELKLLVRYIYFLF